MKSTRALALLVSSSLLAPASQAHDATGHWAADGDRIAAWMIEQERAWAEAGCTGKVVEKDLLAEDFMGTAPDGTLYSKADAVKPPANPTAERECKLYVAKVRYYGDSLAVAYGTEGALRRQKDGTDKRRCLAWTDTWLKRDGAWHIVAVQDMDTPCPR